MGIEAFSCSFLNTVSFFKKNQNYVHLFLYKGSHHLSYAENKMALLTLSSMYILKNEEVDEPKME